MRHKYRLSRKRSLWSRVPYPLATLCVVSVLVVLYITLPVRTESGAQTNPMLRGREELRQAVGLETTGKPSTPILIQIPSINVAAKIDSMGLTKAGDMQAPTEIANGGWYKYGPNPGNEGSAVIAGHRTGKQNKPGVFSNLHKLKPGDTILITDDKNQTISFTVREIRSYRQDENPAEVFRSSKGAHLNLITCAGDWLASENQYSTRLVVFADKTTTY